MLFFLGLLTSLALLILHSQNGKWNLIIAQKPMFWTFFSFGGGALFLTNFRVHHQLLHLLKYDQLP